MSDHRYSLERGTKKLKTCPSCGKKEFVRYIDKENNNEPLNDTVGRCNRESKCLYHYTPKEYFAATGTKPTSQQETDTYQPIRRTPLPTPPKTHIPDDVLKVSMQAHDKNTLIKYLLTLFDSHVVNARIATYRIGSSNGSKYWKDKDNIPAGGAGESAIFWFINREQQIRAGQVRLFDRTGHAAKYYKTTEQEYRSCTTWVYYLIVDSYKKARKAPPQWLTDYIRYKEFGDKQIDCFFGEHLINLPENINKPIAIVEAPKSAIVASVFLPQYVWIASGSLSYLTVDRCEILKGRSVTLYPDLGEIKNDSELIERRQYNKNIWEYDRGFAYNYWKQIADKAGLKYKMSDILEKEATPEQRAKGLDICDFLDSDIVRNDLINSYKGAIVELIAGLDSNPETIQQAVNVWLSYQAKGLRVQDAQRAHRELMEQAEPEQAATNIIVNQLQVAA